MSQPVILQGGGSPVVQQRAPTPVVVQRDGGAAVVVQKETKTVVVAVAKQGPPGRDADVVTGALTVVNRLSEFASDPAAQADAQQNIGLGAVDPLAYYILAKA